MDSVNARQALFDRIARLRSFGENAANFWKEFVAVASELVEAERASLLIRSTATAEWRRIGAAGENRPSASSVAKFNRRLPELASEAAAHGNVLSELEAGPLPGRADTAVGLRLRLGNAGETVVLVALLTDVSRDAAKNALESLTLISDAPEAYLINQTVGKAEGEVRKFSIVLDLLAELDQHKRFLSAVMAVCNGIADRFGCDRVSLGWTKRGYIHLMGMSLTDRVDRKTEAARGIECAMEEACDQDQDIVVPMPADANYVALAHSEITRRRGAALLCTLPLRDDGKPVAAITCERAARPFSEVEVQQLRLAVDLMARRLADLHRSDRWFGARWSATLRNGCARLIGPENTWAKLAALLGMVVLALLVFVKVDYRVEAKCIVRSDEVAFVAAPFDGYLEKVAVKTGDQVVKSDLLVQLNTEDLLLQKSSALADISRHQREMEKARAARSLAEMRISEALMQQSRAQLELVEYRLKQATIRTDFAGIVVEGDLRQRVGSPVKQSEALFRLARLEALFLEADLSERDFHEVVQHGTGEVAFLSRPEQVFPIKIRQIESAAIPREEGNVFLVSADFRGKAEDWWRPGMSGLCKFEVGKRRLIWIFTHRTVDFLRMWLWW